MRKVMVLLIAVLMAGATIADAQMCGGMGAGMGMGRGSCGMMSSDMRGCGMGPGGMECGMSACGPCAVVMLFDGLDLTDAQWEEVDAILAEYEEARMAALDGARGAGSFEGFIELFSSSDLAVSDLNGLAVRAATLREEIDTLENEALVELHDVLTPAQLTELADYASADDPTHGGRGGCRMGGMGGMGRGGCMR